MTNYLVYSGLNVTISDTSGGDFGIGQGIEIIDSIFGPEVTIDLYGLAVSSLLSNASEIVHSGGVDSGSTVYGGGSAFVAAGGEIVGATVYSGGELLLSSGAIASALTVDSGG